MARIVKLLIVGLVLVFAVTEGWPRLKRQLEGRSRRPISSLEAMDASSGAEAECLRLANRAADEFGSGIAAFVTPPIDPTQWERFADTVQQAARDGAYACSCGHDACGLGARAMNDLDGVVEEMNGAVRGGRGLSNPASRLDGVYDMLNEARASLSAG